MKPATKVGLRWGLSLLLLALVVWLVDPADLWARLRQVQWPWLVLALALTPLQVTLSAWRWRFTVRKLGGSFSLAHAVGEYYLGTLVNQLVPGGVVGDAGRAIRHQRRTGIPAMAVHAVMIERLSGQLVLFGVAVLMLLFWLPVPRPPIPGLFLLPVILIGALLLRPVMQAPPVARWWAAFRFDVHRALLSRTALPVQLASSLLVIGSYLGVFWCLAKGLGLPVATASPGLLLALCTVLLMAMVIPLTTSGWGIREGAAAMLWPLAGLEAEQGVALAVIYGLVVLVSALPGAVFLFSSGRPEPGQTACRCPG